MNRDLTLKLKLLQKKKEALLEELIEVQIENELEDKPSAFQTESKAIQKKLTVVDKLIQDEIQPIKKTI